MCDNLKIPFDFIGDKPTERIISCISSTLRVIIFCGVSALLKSCGVILLTLTSVV